MIHILQRPTDHFEDDNHVVVDDPSYKIKVIEDTTTAAAATTAIVTKSSDRVVHIIPVLAFGMYQVPNDDDGVTIILDAIRCGYRHFDCASIYGNEKTFGKALALSTAGNDIKIDRSQLFIASKVWNDAQKDGRIAVRRSVEQSLIDLQIDYLDICYVHWPVPKYFIETYRELMLLRTEKKIRFIGISNFNKLDYEELLSANIPSFIPPLINQFEVSPLMYRSNMIQYFQEEKGILIAASKALNRGSSSTLQVIQDIARSNFVSPAQVLLRWSYQKKFIVLSKTSNLLRMRENRDILGFCLSNEEIQQLDYITTSNDIRIREELEVKRKSCL